MGRQAFVREFRHFVLAILEQINPAAKVISIDIEDRMQAARELPIVQRRVQFIIGSSTATEVVAEVRRQVEGKKVVFDVSGYKRESVLLVKELLEAGRYRAVIDRTYPLEDVVEATRYVESWQKTGNVVLKV